MTGQVGERLTELNHGDSVIVTVNGTRYRGDVTDTKRRKCELNRGFMESGSIAIYLGLNSKTGMDQDTSTECLLITATEDAPQAWDVPTASAYDPTKDETIAELGDVTEVKVTDSEID